MNQKILFFVFAIIFCSVVRGQDIIYKADGNEIKAKVIEIDETVIKYKNFDQQDGPIRSLNKASIFLIIYQDGKREKFDNPVSTVSQQSNLPSNPHVNYNTAEPQKNNKITKDYLDLKIEKTETAVKVGKGLFYAGGILTVAGLIGTFANSGSNTVSDIMLFGGAGIWVTGIIVWAVSGSAHKDFENRRAQLSIQISPPVQNMVNQKYFNTPQLGLNIRF